MWLNFKGKLCDLSHPLVMGILNYTEDSFFDGGRYNNEKAIVDRAAQLLEEGADIIDIGAMSTRPGAADIDEATEIERIRQAVTLVLQHFPMINDVSGGTFDEEMIPTVAKARVPYCLMHTPAKPDVMQQHTQYENLIGDMLRFFGTQVAKLKELGANDIILDPGFGFGKTLEQNYFLMNNLNAFGSFGLPILVGISRKSMIYKLLNTNAQQALNGTTVLNTIALMKGAHILRVHDVREAKECVKMVEMCQNT